MCDIDVCYLEFMNLSEFHVVFSCAMPPHATFQESIVEAGRVTCRWVLLRFPTSIHPPQPCLTRGGGLVPGGAPPFASVICFLAEAWPPAYSAGHYGVITMARWPGVPRLKGGIRGRVTVTDGGAISTEGLQSYSMRNRNKVCCLFWTIVEPKYHFCQGFPFSRSALCHSWSIDWGENWCLTCCLWFRPGLSVHHSVCYWSVYFSKSKQELRTIYCSVVSVFFVSFFIRKKSKLMEAFCPWPHVEQKKMILTAEKQI